MRMQDEWMVSYLNTHCLLLAQAELGYAIHWMEREREREREEREREREKKRERVSGRSAATRQH